jgi:hypothetical protein
MALAMVPAGSSRPIEKIVPGPLCFDAHFGAPLPPAPGAAAPPPPPPPPSVRHWKQSYFNFMNVHGSSCIYVQLHVHTRTDSSN